MAWVRFRKKDMPGGLWGKCPRCSEMVYTKDLAANSNVCPKCQHHLPCDVDERIRFTLDEGSYVEVFEELKGVDRLDFKDKTTYGEKLIETAKKVKHQEGMSIGLGKIHGRDVAFGAMNFKFLGGSMGVVVGEKVTLAVELAMEHKLPLVLVCASGGARMHEGALSLMQMAKTCNALARFAQQGGLYLSVLTDPTTGGVTASFATMADVILAEPNALIGFAGPRVIQNTIKQELPDGFQRSEFLEKRGQVDVIVSRLELRNTIARLLAYLAPLPGAAPLPVKRDHEVRRANADTAGDAASDPGSETDAGSESDSGEPALDFDRRHLNNGRPARKPEEKAAAAGADASAGAGRGNEKPKKKKK
jgi:acetyl-CoA carboxylase carboxyl transferase subunit beta